MNQQELSSPLIFAALQKHEIMLENFYSMAGKSKLLCSRYFFSVFVSNVLTSKGRNSVRPNAMYVQKQISVTAEKKTFFHHLDI